MAYTKQGYLFTTLALANSAISEINLGEGIPNNGFETQTYCIALPCLRGFYIEQDSITEKYLSNPSTITINQNKPI